MEQVTPKRALLITGTIVPNSNFVAHANVEQRRQEYLDALTFYRAGFPKDDLFFLENSAHDFTRDPAFMQLLSDQKITLMKFPVSDKFEQGKGYQEFEMLDATVDRLSGTHTSFIKITGRYKVLNLGDITRKPCKGLTADSHKKLKVVQTNVFYVSAEFYTRYLKGLYRQVNDAEGRYIEHVVYEKTEREKAWNAVNLFPKNPVITGVSGSYGGTLQRNKTKMKLRNIERTMLNTFGIHRFLIEY